jgi:hypothetical protein
VTCVPVKTLNISIVLGVPYFYLTCCVVLIHLLLAILIMLDFQPLYLGIRGSKASPMSCFYCSWSLTFHAMSRNSERFTVKSGAVGKLHSGGPGFVRLLAASQIKQNLGLLIPLCLSGCFMSSWACRRPANIAANNSRPRKKSILVR